MQPIRVDLHVHSSHSNKPTYWAMRKFNCPESYTSLQMVYQTAKARGSTALCRSGFKGKVP